MPRQTPIILASASPRRQELLKNAGIEFIVRPSHIPEVPLAGETPRAFGERMAREKARAARTIARNSANDREPRTDDLAILAADTVVAVGDEILGKPEGAADAARMLRLLSNRTHEVITAVCLLGDGFEDVRSETTAVHFDAMSEVEIAEYVATGEPMDKAGAYAIQGRASRWISKIDGDYYNVVGLPVDLVWRMLHEHNVV
ncbi:MAG TPA: Maf family protein [Terriglobales bacterium]